MTWFERLMPSRVKAESRSKSIPEGLWSKCDGCEAVLYRAELERNLFVCPKCTHHMRITARQRLQWLFDETPGAKEVAKDLKPRDPLQFKDSKRYRDRVAQMQKKTKENDALLVMSGMLFERPLVAASFDFQFMAGSMGAVVGEKFVRAVNAAIEARAPLVCFSASGGARMQEGLFSLMQMSKTSAALGKLRAAGLPYFSVMTDPTTGGVSASLALLGDVNMAEPKALIGFAGPRVIEQTVKETLPEGFQSSEFLLEHGAIDMVVDRREMRHTLAGLSDKLLAAQS